MEPLESPVLEKHLAFLKNNALEIHNHENILLGRQSNYDLRVGFQNLSERISSKPTIKNVIKEIITEEKDPVTHEVTRTVHSGQLNVQAAIHNFYGNLYKRKPCNDDPLNSLEWTYCETNKYQRVTNLQAQQVPRL